MYRLVIAEKPSVAMSIAKVLGATARKEGHMEGEGWLVSWCIGHLAGLAEPAVYNPGYDKWRREDLPILPESWRFTIGKDKREQFDILRTLLRREDVSEVVNACDAGREGELIFRTAYHLAGCTKPMKRLWISSMEDSAIREGFDNLHPGSDYDGLHQAALCRQKADWLVGINATRLFSVLYADLAAKADEATGRYHELSARIKAAEQRMAEIAVLKTHIINYSKTRDTYVAYRKAGYSKKFKAEHESEILLHQTAKKAFDELGLKKLPTVKSLQAEYAALLAEKKSAYTDYRRARDEMKELLTVRANVDRLMGYGGAEPDKETERQEER